MLCEEMVRSRVEAKWLEEGPANRKLVDVMSSSPSFPSPSFINCSSFPSPSPPPSLRLPSRHTCVAVPSSYLPLTRSFMTLLLSKPFCLLLAHMTELDLAEDVIKLSTPDGQSHVKPDQQDCNPLDLQLHSESLVRPDQQESSLDQQEMKGLVRDCSEMVTTSSGHASSQKHKNSSLSQSSSGSPDSQGGPEPGGLELKSSALCWGELCYWRHGDYTLAGDPTDPGLGRFCLEASICFNPEGAYALSQQKLLGTLF